MLFRSIGTVICPDADVKFFITASVEARSQRRFKELLGLGMSASIAAVTTDIKARDTRDATRSTAPTRPAADAIVIDTSELGVDEALKLVLATIKSRKGI